MRNHDDPDSFPGLVVSFDMIDNLLLDAEFGSEENWADLTLEEEQAAHGDVSILLTLNKVPKMCVRWSRRALGWGGQFFFPSCLHFVSSWTTKRSMPN